MCQKDYKPHNAAYVYYSVSIKCHLNSENITTVYCYFDGCFITILLLLQHCYSIYFASSSQNTYF